MRDTLDSVFPEYRHMNGDAHRMRSRNIKPRTLIWHQAFWIVGENERSFRETRNRVKNEIDMFLSRLSCDPALEKSNDELHDFVTPFVDDRSVFFSNISLPKSKIIDKDFYKNWKNKEILEKYIKTNYITQGQIDLLNEDHRTVSYAFSWNNIDITIRFEIHTEFFTKTIFARLSKEIFDYDQNPETGLNLDKLNKDNQKNMKMKTKMISRNI